MVIYSHKVKLRKARNQDGIGTSNQDQYENLYSMQRNEPVLLLLDFFYYQLHSGYVHHAYALYEIYERL